VSIETIPVAFDDLASGDKWRFVWGFFWRGLCLTAASAVGGGIAGGVVGFVVATLAGVLGKSLSDVMLMIRILGGVAGAIVGFAMLWLLIRWLFRVHWFGYRLRLVREPSNNALEQDARPRVSLG
jgi:hypothetical protein